MKKFTLLSGALCAVFTASAVELSELTMDDIVDLRLTAEQLMQVEGSKRIAIRCTQRHGNQNTFFNGTTRVNLPFTEATVFEWESTGEGTYYLKKAFTEENAYMQTANITTFGAKDASTVAKFTAVYPDGFTSVDVITSEHEANAEDYYLRLSLGATWFNFNGFQYNNGTGVWTVQNVIDLSSFYKLTINQVKDGVTTAIVKYVQVGDEIVVPEYDGYENDYVATVKTADDDQEITVNYTSLIELVENETVATKIVDGAVIVLKTVDDNAKPSGSTCAYFNGAGVVKTNDNVAYTNFFKVVGVEGSENGAFYLQQLSSGTYIGIDGSTVTAVEDMAGAAQFTAYIPEASALIDWTTKPDDCTAGVNTVRFETNSTFLNCQPNGVVPKYATGTGGYSYWYVYVYSPKAVSNVGKAYLSAKLAVVKEDTPGFYAPASDLTEVIEKAGSDETMTADEINAADAVLSETVAAGVNLTGPFNGVYTISNKDGNSSRGYLCYVEAQSDYVWSSGKAIADVTLPAKEDDYSKWAFVTINGKALLFNVGAKSFIYPTGTAAETPWSLSKEKAEGIDLALSPRGVGIVEISSTFDGTTYHMSISNGFPQPVGGYYAANDGGVPFVFERVGDLSEELKAEMAAMNPTTGIEEIAVESDKVQGIYDLQGRRLSAPVKGINIINGKKVLVK